jgi:uncharacterized protein YcbX
MAILSEINVYPIKSCGGISLMQADIGELGLMFDRHWMLVDADGRFLTQRSVPQMACITPALDAGHLIVSAPGMADLHVAHGELSGAPLQIQVWKDSFIALDQGDEASAWFSAYLKTEVRLVRFDPAVHRACSADWTSGFDAGTQFSDGFPLLVIGEASLQELNGRLQAKGAPALPMNRFRPNLVLSGLEAYEEDFIDTISFGDGPQALQIKLVKPCARCPVPGIDQRSGLRDPQWPNEPLDTMAAYRANQRVGGGLCFGQNSIVIAGVGSRIRAGQEFVYELNF